MVHHIVHHKFTIVHHIVHHIVQHGFNMDSTWFMVHHLPSDIGHANLWHRARTPVAQVAAVVVQVAEPHRLACCDASNQLCKNIPKLDTYVLIINTCFSDPEVVFSVNASLKLGSSTQYKAIMNIYQFMLFMMFHDVHVWPVTGCLLMGD